MVFVNQSVNSKTFFWNIPALNFTSTDKNPSVVFTEAGTFEVYLTCKNGDGKEAAGKIGVDVLPDTIYRLSNKSKKVWIVKSIIYGGNEILTQGCQKDDEFTVYKASPDTCIMTEGNIKCPPGTYIFELPTSSQWRYNSKNKAFEFGLVASGSPINLSFEITELTNQVFKGIDKMNGVSIVLERK